MALQRRASAIAAGIPPISSAPAPATATNMAPTTLPSIASGTSAAPSSLSSLAIQPLSPQQAVLQAEEQYGFMNGMLPWGGTDPTTGVNLRNAIVGNAYTDWLGSNFGWQSTANIDPGAGNAGGIAATSPGIGIGESGVGISASLGGPAISGFGTGYAGAPTTGGVLGALGPGQVGYGGPTSAVPGLGYGGLSPSNVSGITGALEGTAALSGYGVPAGLAGETGTPSSPGYGSPSSPGFSGGFSDGGVAGFGSASAFGGPTGLGIGNPGEAGIGFGSSIGSVGLGGDTGFGSFASDAGIGSGIGDGSGGGGGGGGGGK